MTTDAKIEHPSTHMGTKEDWNNLLHDILYRPEKFKPLKEVICCTCYGEVECTCGKAVEVHKQKVWVVFDPLYERVISVHSTEGGADDRCFEENDNDNRWDTYYPLEVQDFELEV